MNRALNNRQQALGTAVIVGLLLGMGCAGSSSADGSGNPTTSNDAGATGLGDDGGTSLPPPVDAGCVPQPGADLPDDDFTDSNCDGIDGDIGQAIFVATSGSDSAPGTIAQPVKTIAKAVSLAAAAKKYVIVANGSYADAIVVDATAVSLYGGYQPQGWQRINDRASVSPGTGVPLTLRNVTDPVVVDRLALKAPDASDPGASSYAAIVTGSQNVTLKHLALTAGRGADGLTPTPPSALPPAADGTDGESLPTVTCDKSVAASIRNPACNENARGGSDGTLGAGAGGWGGAGWNREVYQAYGHDGAPGSPIGFGGPGAQGAGDGQPGIGGLRGAGGSPALDGFGTLTKDGYVASNTGTAGATGSVGGSGGGGAGGGTGCLSGAECLGAYYFVGGGGGQGGYGGAAGAGAPGSGGGGASIGVFVFASNVTLASCDVTTSDGGHGGDAVAGADGQRGGSAGHGGTGTAPPNGAGYNGGSGGPGGPGGAGGPGGGGPSIGILVSGAAPTKQGVTLNIGAGGKGGRGTPGVNDGADGVAEENHLAVASDGGTDGGA